MTLRFLTPRFLSLPIRHALEGVSWASLSVRWIPTEAQKEHLRQQRRDEIDTLWLSGERPEVRPPLHPLGGRRFPFERFYARVGRMEKAPWPARPFTAYRPCGRDPPVPE